MEEQNNSTEQSSTQEQPQEVTFSIEQQSKIDGMLSDAKKQWEDEFLNLLLLNVILLCSLNLWKSQM